MKMNALDALLRSIYLLTLPLWCSKPYSDSQLNDTKYDFIVVGGGSAGSVVASRLSENPNVKVLLLEAGGCPPVQSIVPAASSYMLGTNVDWNFLSTEQTNACLSSPNQRVVYPSAKMLGGGSSINGMIYMRGNMYNYDSWAALGNRGWAFKDVLPLFLKSEDNTIPSQEKDTTYHNTTGPLKISESISKYKISQVYLNAALEQGYSITDPNGPNQTGFSNVPFTINNGARSSIFYEYLLPAENRSNLIIATNATVTKVLFNTTGKLKAVGVQYTMNNKTYETYANKEIIISAGTFNSPKILLLSGIGPKLQLQEHKIPVVLDLPGVGQNLHDHVECQGLEWTINCTECPFYANDPLSSSNIDNWIINRQGPATDAKEKLNGFITTKFAEEKASVPDIQLTCYSFNIPNNTTGQLIYVPTLVIYPFAIAPKSRGSLTLQSADPFQPPNINPNLLSNPDDLNVLVEGVKAAIKILNSTAFKVYGPQLNSINLPGCKNYPQFSDEYWGCACRYMSGPGIHAVGTCKMGNSSDSMAVVDAELQVYGIIGLRVIDISIMPSVTGGNTNAPAIMIGEKGADMIKKAHGL